MKKTRHQQKKSETAEQASLEAALIPLTVPEVRKLLWQWLWRHPPRIMHIVNWSLWRRRHQTIARACHYRRRRKKNNLQLVVLVASEGSTNISNLEHPFRSA